MTWNCLADGLALGSYNGKLPFPHTDQDILKWDYRYPLIINEINRVCPDILCLAEIDTDHYKNEFFDELIILSHESLRLF